MRKRTSRWQERWQRGQRGAVLVEAALVLPVIITLTLGIIEFGLVFKDSLTIANATRAGARVGAATTANGSLANQDYYILQAVESGLTGLSNNTLTGVLIYNATPTS